MPNSFSIKKILLNIVFFAAIFVMAVLVWYSPVVFKGHAPGNTGTGVILARNMALTGKYSLENDKNVFLSSGQIEKQGMPSTFGNRLTPKIYSYILKITGPISFNGLIFVSSLLNALALLFLTAAVMLFFDKLVAGIFALIYIFLPATWQLPYSIVGYEFGILFLSVFLLFFFLAEKSESLKKRHVFLALAGGLLGLAALAKEVFLPLAPIIFLFWLFRKQWKKIIWFFAPLALILAIFYLPSFFSGENRYLNLVDSGNQKVKFTEYGYYAHLFPDPYTFAHNKGAYIQERKAALESEGIVGSLETRKSLAQFGYESVGLFYRAFVGGYLFLGHLARFISFEVYGGPFVFLLFLGGLWLLKKQKKDTYNFMLYVLIGSLLAYSFVLLVSRDHAMDFAWAFVLPAAIAVKEIILKLKANFPGRLAPIALAALVLFGVVYNFVLAGHVVWARTYDQSDFLRLQTYADNIKTAQISDEAVIATALPSYDISTLNFLADKNFVVFKPETVSSLLAKDELKSALDEYDVVYILGYDQNLTDEIIEETGAINLGLSDVEIVSLPSSPLRSWFLNLVK